MSASKLSHHLYTYLYNGINFLPELTPKSFLSGRVDSTAMENVVMNVMKIKRRIKLLDILTKLNIRYHISCNKNVQKL